MRILLTGSSGRIGRAIFNATARLQHEIVGLDRHPFSTTRIVGDFAEKKLLQAALIGVDAVIHTASLHAPHVGVRPNPEFEKINILGLRTLIATALDAGVKTIVYTSTTALYGASVVPGQCTWIDEDMVPVPTTIYHRTKVEAESLLEAAAGPRLAVRIMRMSRCFPESADLMAAYRLHRGIDARDVAEAHVAALFTSGPCFQRYVVSGLTPFQPGDVGQLAVDAPSVLAERCPGLLSEFSRRNWPLPRSIDRVYDAGRAARLLDWKSRFGFDEVLAQHDRVSLEVLPRVSWHQDRTSE